MSNMAFPRSRLRFSQMSAKTIRGDFPLQLAKKGLGAHKQSQHEITNRIGGSPACSLYGLEACCIKIFLKNSQEFV
jgi:hypothetical protein